MQLAFANEIKEHTSLQESLIAGLLASVIAHQTHSEKLSMKDFLLHIDAFSHLVYATGVSEEQVKLMYPKILDSVIKTVEAQS